MSIDAYFDGKKVTERWVSKRSPLLDNMTKATDWVRGVCGEGRGQKM